jgi:hypothetical protein
VVGFACCVFMAPDDQVDKRQTKTRAARSIVPP